MNTVLDKNVLRFSLSSEYVDQINTLAKFRGRENWTILGDDGSLNGYKGIQYQLNKICFDFIPHHDEIILRSFISSLSFVFYTCTPEIQMKGAFLCSLGIYAKPFPIKQYSDEVAG